MVIMIIVISILFLAQSQSYIKDTTDFLCKLKDIAMLATLDVKSLYTNIPHTYGIQAIPNTVTDRDIGNLMCELSNFVLTHNNFQFDESMYLQISDTAMGTRMTPQYANIFIQFNSISLLKL